MKWEADGNPDKFDADKNTGFPLLLDANDGNVERCTFVQGERQVMQLRGGTMTLIAVHPFQSAAFYTRTIHGAAGVPIVMPHQLRGLDEVEFDPLQVAVARDKVWRLVVTPLIDIPEETPAVIRYRRDPVNIELRGFGSDWIAPYLDGGTIRAYGHTPNVIGGRFVPGGAELPSGRCPAAVELVANRRGQRFDLTRLDIKRHGNLDARAIAHPNLAKPNAWPGHTAEELAAWPLGNIIEEGA